MVGYRVISLKNGISLSSTNMVADMQTVIIDLMLKDKVRKALECMNGACRTSNSLTYKGRCFEAQTSM